MIEVLFCKWNVVNEDDMIEAMERIGLNVRIFDEKIESVDYDKAYLKKFSDTLMEQSCTFVFSVNFIPIVSRVCKVFHKLYLSWMVDSPMIMLYSRTLESEYNRIVYFDKTQYETFRGRNPQYSYYMPLGTNINRWDKIRITDDDRERYTSDVSFVGSLYTEKSNFNQIEELSEYLKGYISGVIEAQLKIYGYNFIEKLLSDEIIKEFRNYVVWKPLGNDYIEDERAIIAHGFIGMRCTELERQRMLSALSKDFDVALYTGSDTSQLPGLDRRGTVDYKTEMPKVFKLSKINLNFTSKPIQTGLPLRIFDIMGSGGFLITNYQMEIPEYFEIGKDLVVFENEADLKEKVAYYLKHDDIRKEIACNGYCKVKEHFSYEDRIKDILALVGIPYSYHQ